VPFASPLALLGLLFLPVVVAMYLLKLRRDEAVVPSTLLWNRLVADVEANAPWQRLRRSLLLLLQLLLVVILALLAARPFLERPAGLARDIVLIVDASASMAATDVAPNRLAAAKQAALDTLRDLPAGGKVSIIAAGRAARVVATGSSDMGRIRQAIASIEVSSASGDMGDALHLASALAARSGDAEIVVATDAALATVPTTRVDAPVRVLQVGRQRQNQAIVALAIRTAPSGLTKSAFISVANLDDAQAKRRLEVYADGQLIDARDLYVDPQARADIIVDDITQGGSRRVDAIEVRLVDDPGEAASNDRLALDDHAWAIVPPDRQRRILLVTDGDPYLETALTYLPNTELYGISLDKYGPSTHPELFDLIIFDGRLPATLPATAMLAIAPAQTSALGEVSGTLDQPGIGTLDPQEPMLRYVDLSTTHIAAAKKLVLPDWARTVIPGPAGAPLLYVGDRAGLKTAVLAFEPRRSDLPLQIAFPILIANLTGELLGGSAAPSDAIEPGAPVSLPVSAGSSGVRVLRPDGSTVDLVPGTVGGTAVTFSQTDQLGVYTVTPIRPSAGSPEPTETAVPTPPPTPSPGASGAAPSRSPGPAADPSAPYRFAVDLFDINESNIAPGNSSVLTALGAPAAASPGASVAPGSTTGPASAGGATTERPAARDELWVPLVLVVLLVLCIEWAVYQRDALIRLWRRVGGQLGRRSPDVT
jgi:Ca-activated chloride channel family protein